MTINIAFDDVMMGIIHWYDNGEKWPHTDIVYIPTKDLVYSYATARHVRSVFDFEVFPHFPLICSSDATYYRYYRYCIISTPDDRVSGE